MKCSCIFSLALLAASAAAGQAPGLSHLSEKALSPDGRLGILVPRGASTGSPELIEVKTGRILATLEARDVDAVWSKDGSTLVWSAKGKWGPWSMAIIEIKKGRVISQTDILSILQNELYRRLKKAEPALYAKIEKENGGSGLHSLFMDVYARPSQDAGSVLIVAGLTSDPNDAQPYDLQLQADITAQTVPGGKLAFGEFHSFNPAQLARLRDQDDKAAGDENKVYMEVLRHTPAAQRKTLEKEESDWKSRSGDAAECAGFSFMGARYFQADTALFQKRAATLRARMGGG